MTKKNRFNWKKYLVDFLELLKKWLSLWLLLFAVNVYGVDQIESFITVTNEPTATDTIVVNGETRTWVSSSPSVDEILITAAGSNSQNATNLLHAVAKWPFTNNVYSLYGATNIVRLFAQTGSSLDVSLTGEWGSFTLITNNVTTAFTTRVPISAEFSADHRTNVASWLVTGINSFSNQKFTTNVLPDLIISDELVDLIGSDVTNQNVSTLILHGATNHVANLSTSTFWFAASPGSGVTNVLGYHGTAGNVSLVGPTNQPVLNVKGLGSNSEITFVDTDGTNVHATITDFAVNDSKLRSSAARSVIGRSAGTSGQPADIVGGVANTYLNDDGSTLAFRAILVDEIIEDLAFLGDITPSQITANQDDYNPPNNDISILLRLFSDASRDITGLADVSEGKFKIIANVGSFDIVLKNEDAGSSTANRFSIGADIIIGPGEVVTLIYDGISSRWRAITTPPSASASAGGSNTEVQFNAAGLFDGDANFIWDDTTKSLTTSNFTANGLSTFNGNAIIKTNITWNDGANRAVMEVAGRLTDTGADDLNIVTTSASAPLRFGEDGKSSAFTVVDSAVDVRRPFFATSNATIRSSIDIESLKTQAINLEDSGAKHRLTIGNNPSGQGSLTDSGADDLNVLAMAAANVVRFGIIGDSTIFTVGNTAIDSRRPFFATSNATFRAVNTVDETIIFEDSTTAPAAAGEIRRDGADVKVFSGGAVRNLSDIGASSSLVIAEDSNLVLVNPSTNDFISGAGMLVSGTAVGTTAQVQFDVDGSVVVTNGSSPTLELVTATGFVHTDSISSTGRTLHDSVANLSVDWENHLLADSSGFDSVRAATRELVDSAGNTVIDWQDNKLAEVFDGGGITNVAIADSQLTTNKLSSTSLDEIFGGTMRSSIFKRSAWIWPRPNSLVEEQGGFLDAVWVKDGSTTNSLYDAQADGWAMMMWTAESVDASAGYRDTTSSAGRQMRRDHYPTFDVIIRPESTNSTRYYVGLSGDGSSLTGDTPLDSKNGIMFGKAAADDNWQIFHNDSDATMNLMDTGVTVNPSNSVWLAIQADPDNNRWLARIDNGTNIVVDSEIPAATTDLGPIIHVESSEAASKTNFLFRGWFTTGAHLR